MKVRLNMEIGQIINDNVVILKMDKKNNRPYCVLREGQICSWPSYWRSLSDIAAKYLLNKKFKGDKTKADINSIDNRSVVSACYWMFKHTAYLDSQKFFDQYYSRFFSYLGIKQEDFCDMIAEVCKMPRPKIKKHIKGA